MRSSIGIVAAQQRYNEWWVGKRCRTAHGLGPFRKVVAVNVYGPPSYVYGTAELVFAGGRTQTITSPAYRPRKCDVEVEANKALDG